MYRHLLELGRDIYSYDKILHRIKLTRQKFYNSCLYHNQQIRTSQELNARQFRQFR